MIDEQHVLPCDFVVGHMRFRKGVKLETVRRAAERWLKAAQLQNPADLGKMIEQITDENRHEAVEI